MSLAAALPSVGARADQPKPRSPQEEQRRRLLEEVGLEKKKQPPPASGAPDGASPGAAPGGTPAPSEGDMPEPAGDARHAQASRPTFRRVVHPMLLAGCRTCHGAGGAAAATRLVLTGDPAADHGAVARLLDTHNPAASPLLAKASGASHAGGAPWPAGGAAERTMLAWIGGGARLDGSAPKAAGAVAASAPPAEPPAAKGSETSVKRRAEAAPPRAADGAGGLSSPTPAVPTFADVHPLLMKGCAACHATGAAAGGTRFVLRGDAKADAASARALVDVAAPAASLLLTKASGASHLGGAVYSPTSEAYQRLLAWISSGAAGMPAGAAPASPPAAAAPEPPSATPVSRRAPDTSDAITAPSPPPAPASSPIANPAHGTLDDLPLGLRLNGRFDLAYERRSFSGSPLDRGATNALRSYHHFLFLSHDTADQPIGISIEVLSLQFWEAHYHATWRSGLVQLTVRGGKILVPFGAEPLFHQSYGGLAGFDQRVLPILWAEEGVSARLLLHAREMALTNDLFAVRGYTLRASDGILNLQNDFSAPDALRPGLGDRVGAAWGPAAAWYSAYYNPLGFHRRLFMQALDVTLSRPRAVPGLGRFSFAGGLLRADVSGGDSRGLGGPGKDYYHFASYFQVRYHPTDFLYVQYRQGLRTFNNRRGLWLDDTRLTPEDGSAHNLGVVARRGGLSGGLFYFINLEKVAEIPDDFIRLVVTYEF